MRSAHLLRTTAFRMALVYLGLFLASVLVILALIYGTTAGFLDQQTDETIAAELEGLLEHYQERGYDGLLAAIRERSAVTHSNALYLLSAPDYQPLAGNLPAWPQAEPDEEGWLRFTIPPAPTATVDTDQPARGIGFTLPDGSHLFVGRDLTERQAFQERIVIALIWALVLTVGLGIAGGILLSRNFVRRLEVVNRTARKIMTGHLHERVPHTGGGDEIDQLASNLNTMLEQIERLMEGMRHVSEGIAHDLRTPLTRLRTRLELALLGASDLEAARSAIQDALLEADRLLATFQALLSIAEAEAGYRQTTLSDLDLGELVASVVDLYEPLAEEKGIRIEPRLPPGPAPVRGHEQLLAQAVANLLDNAVKYAPPGTSILVSVEAGPDPGDATLVVADAGPGIPPGDRERVLRRFVRLERTRGLPGSGLGLSLVDAVARLHGATLTLEDNRPGLRVVIRFKG